TGGLGGIGTELCKSIANRYGTRILIIGRTDLGRREGWTSELERDDSKSDRIRSLLALESAGVDFLYRVADVADSVAVERAIREAEQNWGLPLDGIFHMAGEVDISRCYGAMNESSISSLSLGEFESMFQAKVYGTWTLCQLLSSRPQLLFVAFSSVNG